MNILILTKYPVRGPSSRYRFYQYLPDLTERGHSYVIFPFFTDGYLDVLFSGRRPGPFYLAARVLARLGHCLRGKAFDLAWIEGELAPFLPAFWERGLHWLLPRKRVYEFDDAIWLRYTGKPMLEHKFGALLKDAAGVIVGNAFLRDYVQRFNQRVLVAPTVIDRARYEQAEPALNGRTIGWIGSQATSFYLKEMIPVFQELSQTHPIRLKVVGAQIEAEGFAVECVAWSRETEVALIETFDIGIMPLSPTPWSEGKCGLKLIQYLAAGVPVVASPVGVNRQIVAESRGGYLAEDPEAWLSALRKLLDRRDLRQEMGKNGREWVFRETCLQAWAPRIIAFLETIDAHDQRQSFGP